MKLAVENLFNVKFSDVPYLAVPRGMVKPISESCAEVKISYNVTTAVHR